MKYVLLIILFTGLEYSLFSQINFFLSGGGNYSEVFVPERHRIDKVENQELTSILNFNGGILAEYALKKITFSSGFLFSRRGSSVGENSYLTGPFLEFEELQFYFWEIPCIVRFQLNKGNFELGAGFINSILTAADINLASNIYKPYQIDLKGVVRWNITPKLSTEFGYLYGGLNHFDDFFYYGHSVFNLNINYRIWRINFNDRKNEVERLTKRSRP